METRSKKRTPACDNLHYIAAHGVVKDLKMLINDKADVNALDKDGFTPVFYAASQSRVPKILQTLVEAKADPNVASRYATGLSPQRWAELLEQRRASGHNQLLSPLTWATLKNSVAKVRILIDAKVDVNSMNVPRDKSSSALFLAVEMGSLDIVKLLVEAKAVLHVLNHEAYTVLDVAQEKRHHDIAQLLLDAGAPRGVWWRMQQACMHGRTEEVKSLLDAGHLLHIQNSYSQMPLLLAVQHGHTDIAQMLIAARAQVNVPGTSLLLTSIKQNNVALVRSLVAAHADVNVRERGYRPIVYSVEIGDIELTKSLIDARANVDLISQGYYKVSPLLIAISRGHTGIVNVLLAAKASLAFPPGSDNPLTIAVRSGNTDIMKMLIDAKATLEAAAGKSSPLRVALDNMKLDAMRLLLEAKAATDIPGTDYADNLWFRALDIFVRSQNDEVLRLLLDANPSLASNRDSTKFIGPLYKQRRFSTLQLLLENHASVDGVTGERGLPILYQAVFDNRAPLVKMMIDAKANLSVRGSRYHETPLILASRRRYRDIVQMLLEAKATLDAEDRKGYTPLRHAVDVLHGTLRQYPVDESIVQTLVDANAPLEYSALRAAVDGRQSAVVKILVDAKANLRVRNGQDEPLLMAALAAKSASIIDTLLTADPSLFDECDSNGMTPLMFAITKYDAPHDARNVRMLIEHAWTYCVAQSNDEPPAKRFKTAE